MVKGSPYAIALDLFLPVHALDDYQSDELHYHECDYESSSVIKESIRRGGLTLEILRENRKQLYESDKTKYDGYDIDNRIYYGLERGPP